MSPHLVQFLVRTGSRSFVPTLQFPAATRAGFVKAGPSGSCLYPKGLVLTKPSTARGSGWLGRIGHALADLKIPTVVQNTPSDAGELVGQRDRQLIGMQALCGCIDPVLEAVSLPAMRVSAGQHEPPARTAPASSDYRAWRSCPRIEAASRRHLLSEQIPAKHQSRAPWRTRHRCRWRRRWRWR